LKEISVTLKKKCPPCISVTVCLIILLFTYYMLKYDTSFVFYNVILILVGVLLEELLHYILLTSLNRDISVTIRFLFILFIPLAFSLQIPRNVGKIKMSAILLIPPMFVVIFTLLIHDIYFPNLPYYPKFLYLSLISLFSLMPIKIKKFKTDIKQLLIILMEKNNA
jgi:hypothetical protein